jgi:hypothetical protein
MSDSSDGSSLSTPAPAVTAPDPAAPEDLDPFPGANKKVYVAERIAAPKEHVFHDDRVKLWQQPGFHIWGKCPSCGHDTSAVCATDFLAHEQGLVGFEQASLKPSRRTLHPWRRLMRRGERRRGGRKAMITLMQCACSFNHQPPKGAGPFGCGAEWLLYVTYGPDTAAKVTIDPVAKEDKNIYRCWAAANAAAAEIPTALTNAQASAKNWAGALTALIALSGIGTLLGARSTVQSLDSAPKGLFGALASVALLANAIVLYQSDLAQFGPFNPARRLQPSDLRNADLDPLIEARNSIRRLRTAISAAAVSALAAVSAALILLFVHAAPAAPSSKVTYKTGEITNTTACSTVSTPATRAGGETTLDVTPQSGDKQTKTIPLSQVTTIAGC